MKRKAKGRAKRAAVVTIYDAPRMTARGRRQIAAWLRRRAAMLVKDGRNYTEGRFISRYLYV